MTKEELKQEAEEYCANNCGDCYGCHKKYRKNKNCEKIKSMIKTYFISAEPREKEIKSLGERCLQLQKDKGRLTDQLTNAKEIIREFVEWATWQGSNCPNFKSIQDKAEQFLKENEE